MDRFSRRGAEAQRGLLCVFFSQRLSVSAGVGFGYCVVEFLFHCGVGWPGLEADEWAEFVLGRGAGFPRRR